VDFYVSSVYDVDELVAVRPPFILYSLRLCDRLVLTATLPPDRLATKLSSRTSELPPSSKPPPSFSSTSPSTAQSTSAKAFARPSYPPRQRTIRLSDGSSTRFSSKRTCMRL
jgi:hypothetical protein